MSSLVTSPTTSTPSSALPTPPSATQPQGVNTLNAPNAANSAYLSSSAASTTSAQTAVLSPLGSTTASSVSASGNEGRRTLLTADRSTFKALERDSNNNKITLLEETFTLTGYQLYVNTDWLVKREHLTKTLVVYTGDTTHSIKVNAVTFARTHHGSYPQVVRNLFADFEKDKFSVWETPHGVIMLASLMNFPPAQNILIPGGDFDEAYPMLLLNINLKRYGCGERGIMTLKPPSQAITDKFYQTFNIKPSASETSISDTIKQLSPLIQLSLFLFGLFPRQYVDGLICDTTVAALQSFYNDFGPFEFEITGQNYCHPQLLTSLISTIYILKAKLQSLGYHISRDPFIETEGFMKQLRAFQKQQVLSQTGLLDVNTIQRVNMLFQRSTPSSTVHALKTKLEDIGSKIVGVGVNMGMPADPTKKQPAEGIKTQWTLNGIFDQVQKERTRYEMKRKQARRKDLDDGLAGSLGILPSGTTSSTSTNVSAGISAFANRTLKNRMKGAMPKLSLENLVDKTRAGLQRRRRIRGSGLAHDVLMDYEEGEEEGEDQEDDGDDDLRGGLLSENEEMDQELESMPTAPQRINRVRKTQSCEVLQSPISTEDDYSPVSSINTPLSNNTDGSQRRGTALITTRNGSTQRVTRRKFRPEVLSTQPGFSEAISKIKTHIQKGTFQITQSRKAAESLSRLAEQLTETYANRKDRHEEMSTAISSLRNTYERLMVQIEKLEVRSKKIHYAIDVLSDKVGDAEDAHASFDTRVQGVLAGGNDQNGNMARFFK